jgi:hypothetical protein
MPQTLHRSRLSFEKSKVVRIFARRLKDIRSFWRISSRLTATVDSRQPSMQFMGAAMIAFKNINRSAMAALPAVLGRLIPGGRTVGREYVARNPTRADRRAGSFKINLRTGQWADFATGDKGGDPVSLCAYVEGVSQAEAARQLARMLGIKLEESSR